jgi:peptide/nickel transport system substrate-binding protein
MKNLRWQILIVALALIAIAVLLFVEQPPAIVQPEQPKIQPASGGIYTEALIGSFGRLNPLLDIYNQADRAVGRLLFSGLVRFDGRGLPQVDLAESWGISQDGKDYYFSLRSNARWHDGTPISSKDVIFTIDLLRSPEFPASDDMREFWKQIEVNEIDDRTVQFRLPEPFAPFLDYLSIGILPQHLLNNISAGGLVNDRFNMAPVGSGPFRFERLITENGSITGVILSANREWYKDPPFLDRVIFQYYPDASAALAAYRKGEVSGVSHITQDILAEAFAQENLQIYSSRLPQLSLVYLNLDDPQLPFFQDAKLRRAFLKGINRQWMIDRILNGQAIQADGPIFPGNWAHYENVERLGYDPAGALEYIKEAGYTVPAEGGDIRVKDGIALSFELVYSGDAVNTAIFEALRRDWAKMGVEVKPRPVTYEELLSVYLEPRAYQAALITLDLTQSPDPDPYPFWNQAQINTGQNYAQWNDRKASEYLETARITSDVDERTRAYRNFQVRFTQEMPALPLFFPVYSFGVDVEIQGVRMGPLFDPSDRLANLPEWFILARRQDVSQGEVEPSPTP